MFRNYFNSKFSILLLLIPISILYRYLKHIILVKSQIDPLIGSTFNLNNIYITYTNYTLIRMLTEIISSGVFHFLKKITV